LSFPPHCFRLFLLCGSTCTIRSLLVILAIELLVD
jgi:hypothetical protein